MTADTQQYVSFELDGSLYGLDIRIVKEVHPNTRIAPVPRSADHICGLVNIRGQVVLVIDIAVVFGRPSRPVTDESQVIIMKTAAEIRRIRDCTEVTDPDRFGDKPVGFICDRIGDVVRINRPHMEAAPPHLAEENARYIEGVVGLGQRTLVVLNAVEMLGPRDETS